MPTFIDNKYQYQLVLHSSSDTPVLSKHKFDTKEEAQECINDLDVSYLEQKAISSVQIVKEHIGESSTIQVDK